MKTEKVNKKSLYQEGGEPSNVDPTSLVEHIVSELDSGKPLTQLVMELLSMKIAFEDMTEALLSSGIKQEEIDVAISEIQEYEQSQEGEEVVEETVQEDPGVEQQMPPEMMAAMQGGMPPEGAMPPEAMQQMMKEGGENPYGSDVYKDIELIYPDGHIETQRLNEKMFKSGYIDYKKPVKKKFTDGTSKTQFRYNPEGGFGLPLTNYKETSSVDLSKARYGSIISPNVNQMMSSNPNYRANPRASYLPTQLSRSNSIAPMVANVAEGFTNLFSGKDRDGDGLKDGAFRNLKAKTKKYKDDTAEERAKMYDYKINVDEDDPNLKNYDYSASSLAEAAKTGKLKTNQERFTEKYDFDPSNVMYKFDKEKDAISARAIPIPKGENAEEYLKQSRKTLGDAGYGDLASAKNSLADFVTDKTVAPKMPGMGGIAGSFNQALSSDAMRDFTKEQALKNINKNFNMKYGGQPKFQGDSGPSETSNLAMALQGAAATAGDMMPEDIGEDEREAMLNTLTGKDLEKYKVWLQILDERKKLMGNEAYKKEYDRVQNVKKKLVDLVTKVGEDDESTLLDLGVPKNTLNWLSKGPSGEEGDYYWSCSTAACSAYNKSGATGLDGSPIKRYTSNRAFDKDHEKLGFRWLPKGTVPYQPGQFIRGHAYSEPGGAAGSRHALIYAGPGKIYQNTRGIPSDQPAGRHAFESAATPWTEDGRYDSFFNDDYYNYDSGVMEYIGKLSKWEDKKLQPLLEKFREMEGRNFELEERQKKYPDYKGDIKFNKDGDIIPSGFVNPNAVLEQLEGTGTDPQQMIEILENAPNQSGNAMPSGGGSSSDSEFSIFNPFTWFKEGGESIPNNPGFNKLPKEAQMNIINNMNMGGERQMRYTDILQQARYGLPQAQMENSEQPKLGPAMDKMYVDRPTVDNDKLNDLFQQLDNVLGSSDEDVWTPSRYIPGQRDRFIVGSPGPESQSDSLGQSNRFIVGSPEGQIEESFKNFVPSNLMKSDSLGQQGFINTPSTDPYERLREKEKNLLNQFLRNPSELNESDFTGQQQRIPQFSTPMNFIEGREDDGPSFSTPDGQEPLPKDEWEKIYKQKFGRDPFPGAYEDFVSSFRKARYGIEEYQGTGSSETGSSGTGLSISDRLDMSDMMAKVQAGFDRSRDQNFSVNPFLPQPNPLQMFMSQYDPSALDAYNLANSISLAGQNSDPAITGVVDANGNPVAPGSIPSDIIKPGGKKQTWGANLIFSGDVTSPLTGEQKTMLPINQNVSPNVGGQGGIQFQGTRADGSPGTVIDILGGLQSNVTPGDFMVRDKNTGEVQMDRHTNVTGGINIADPKWGSIKLSTDDITGNISRKNPNFNVEGKINLFNRKKPKDPTGDNNPTGNNRRYGGSSNEIEVDTATLAKLMKAGAKIKIV